MWDRTWFLFVHPAMPCCLLSECYFSSLHFHFFPTWHCVWILNLVRDCGHDIKNKCSLIQQLPPPHQSLSCAWNLRRRNKHLRTLEDFSFSTGLVEWPPLNTCVTISVWTSVPNSSTSRVWGKITLNPFSKNEGLWTAVPYFGQCCHAMQLAFLSLSPVEDTWSAYGSVPVLPEFSAQCKY